MREQAGQIHGEKKARRIRGRCFWVIVLTAAVLFVLALALTGCGEVDPVTKESYYFDTICKITVYDMKDMSEENAEDAITGAFKQCVVYENELSKTKKGSDVYRLNHADGAWVKVGSDTLRLIKKGIAYGKSSGGLFDITIGKAEDLYDFHAEKHTLPTKAKLAEAVQSVDYRQIEVDGSRVRLTLAGGEVDLGGIAKGYIADRISEYLEKEGVTSAIISLGGNVSVIGDKQGDAFQIGIRKPFGEETEYVGVVSAKDLTIVTSGIYERYFKKNGKIYHHILDPKTGEPTDTDLASVTIVAKNGKSADCDALATICLMQGEKTARKTIEKHDGFEAVFIHRDGTITKTSGMDSFQES